MKYSITLYCPDQHVSYDLYTLENKGIGGGITARIRMAHALTAYGHKVTAYINCPEEDIIRGVEYRHFSTMGNRETDILIASTSGDEFDLSSLCGIDIQTRLRILMTHGVAPPKGLGCQSFDFVYALSNFVRELAITNWGIGKRQMFVSPRGIVGSYYIHADSSGPERDPYAIVFASHPSKGLEEAMATFRILRELDSRFSLHLFGGNQLWAQEEVLPPNVQGVFYHGLVGQKELISNMQSYGFSLHLQNREEPFGMAIIEAMRAGCVVLASPVGAYSELVEHQHNGFLVQGNSRLETTHKEASNLIMNLLKSPERLLAVRDNAIRTPFDWMTIADAWTSHFEWALGDRPPNPALISDLTCENCAGKLLSLADGFHCISCGWYQRKPLA